MCKRKKKVFFFLKITSSKKIFLLIKSSCENSNQISLTFLCLKKQRCKKEEVEFLSKRLKIPHDILYLSNY